MRAKREVELEEAAPEFVKIGRESDFPGELTKLSILGRHVGVFRTAGGELVAMEITCRHQNADLTKGRREGDVIVCPRHGWRYDLTTGVCLNEPWARLRRYELRVDDDGEVFLATRPSEEPAPDFLSGTTG